MKRQAPGSYTTGIAVEWCIPSPEPRIIRLRDIQPPPERPRRIPGGKDIDGDVLRHHRTGAFTHHEPTNLVYFTVDRAAAGNSTLDASLLSNRLKARGILANPLGSANQMRMVIHIDVNAADIEDTLAALQSVLHET